MARPPREGSLTAQRRVERAAALAVLVGFSCLFLLPFAITLGDSLKTFQQVYAMPRVWVPWPPNWSNYADIFRVLPFHRFFINSAFVTILAVTGQLISASFVAYSFARLRWPGRDFCFILMLSTLMLPGQVTVIPVYLLFNKFGWIDTYYPLIVPYYFGGIGGGVVFIFLLRQFFKTIPLALEDAAKIDGCSHLRILLTIMVPLAKPALATVAVLSFVHHWNDFFLPLIYLNDYLMYTVPLGISMFKTATQLQPQLVMAASLVSLVPIVVLFFSAQRYFIEGIVLTGTKG